MAAGSSKTGNHTRSGSSVVPAVPRIFEKKARRPSEGTVLAPATGHDHAATGKKLGYPSTEIQVQHGGEKGFLQSAEEPEQDTHTCQNGDEHVPTPKQSPVNTATTAQGIKPDGLKGATGRHSKADEPAESKPKVSLPSYTHYPLDAKSLSKQASRSGITSFPTPSGSQSATQGDRKRHFHNRSVHKIAFGSFVAGSESSESSPTLPPSATSTQFTQPTPASETRSQASASERGEAHAKIVDKILPGNVTDSKSHSSLVGPYRPGLMIEHAIEFAKYRQQFLTQHLQELYRSNNGDVALSVCFDKSLSRFNLHSLIICQSPMMAAAVQLAVNQKQFGPDGKICITIGVQDSFTTFSSVETVLKSMYGFPSLDLKALDQPLLDPREHYSLFAASCLLGLQDHQTFSASCVAELLNWRTLPDVLDLCLAGKTWGPCLDPYPKRSEEITSQLFQPQASFLFDRALSVLLQELSRTDFVLQTDAPNIPSLGGLPGKQTSAEIPETPQRMAFGDLNVGTQTKDSALSSLLLSVPLPVLQRLVAELSVGPNPKVPKVIDSTIRERERRRLAYLQASGLETGKYFKESCIVVDYLPNGIGVINDMS